MKVILLSSVLFIIALNSAHTTVACSCGMPTVKKAFNKSRIVFAGTVIGIEPDSVRFKVTESWKGAPAVELKVYVLGVGSSCDPGVAMGRTLLVYAYPGSSRVPLLTGYCGRTRVLTERDDETKELDALRSSRQGTTPNKSLNRSGGSASRIKRDPAEVLVSAPPG
jgi:hypothetical protein